jgi:hypothetical protein
MKYTNTPPTQHLQGDKVDQMLPARLHYYCRATPVLLRLLLWSLKTLQNFKIHWHSYLTMSCEETKLFKYAGYAEAWPRRGGRSR